MKFLVALFLLACPFCNPAQASTYYGPGARPWSKLQHQVAGTTSTIVASQCGSTFVSDSADVMTLPEASGVLGCRLTFICATTDDFDVNPNDGTDQILPTGALSPAAGDAIRCTDIGAGFVLEAVGANAWAVLSTNLTITDVN